MTLMTTHAHNTDTHLWCHIQHHQRDHNTYANLCSWRWHTALQHGHSHCRQLNSRHTLATFTLLATCTPPATHTSDPTGAATIDMRTSSDTLGITAHWYHIHHHQHCTLMQCLPIMWGTWCDLPKLHTMLDAAHLTYTVDLFPNIYNSPH
jgi:hypothetical protein